MNIRHPILIVSVSMAMLSCTSSDNSPQRAQRAICTVSDCGVLDPAKLGPYAVGVTDRLYLDARRNAMGWDTCVHPEGGDICPRPLMATIWYPATDAALDKPAMNFSEFIGVPEDEIQEFVDELVELLGGDELNFQIPDKTLIGRRDVPVRPGQYPIIIFSHGAGGVRFQSVFLTEFLASHGYVVISADHEGDATFTIIKHDGREDFVPLQPRVSAFAKSAIERPIDMGFLIDKMVQANTDTTDMLYGHLATEAIGASGHSFGAFTSITRANVDPRIKAIVPMAMFGITNQFPGVPTLHMIATEDDTIEDIANSVTRHQYETGPAPRALLELGDAGHFTYSNMCDLIPDFSDGCGLGRRIELLSPRTDGTKDKEPMRYIAPDLAFALINYYTTAFFGLYLKGVEGYRTLLTKEPYKDKARYQLRVRFGEEPGGEHAHDSLLPTPPTVTEAELGD